MASEALKNAIAGYGAPRSNCTCNHTGDGPDSEHRDAVTEGQGACKVEGCNCRRFVWSGWTKAFQGFVDAQGV